MTTRPWGFVANSRAAAVDTAVARRRHRDMVLLRDRRGMNRLIAVHNMAKLSPDTETSRLCMTVILAVLSSKDMGGLTVKERADPQIS